MRLHQNSSTLQISHREKPLCPIVTYYATLHRENRYLQVLRNTAGLNSYLGLFAFCTSKKQLQSAKRPLSLRTQQDCVLPMLARAVDVASKADLHFVNLHKRGIFLSFPSSHDFQIGTLVNIWVNPSPVPELSFLPASCRS